MSPSRARAPASAPLSSRAGARQPHGRRRATAAWPQAQDSCSGDGAPGTTREAGRVRVTALVVLVVRSHSFAVLSSLLVTTVLPFAASLAYDARVDCAQRSAQPCPAPSQEPRRPPEADAERACPGKAIQTPGGTRTALPCKGFPGRHEPRPAGSSVPRANAAARAPREQQRAHANRSPEVRLPCPASRRLTLGLASRRLAWVARRGRDTWCHVITW